MLEAIALMGALLLALDRQIHGSIRERIVVAYYRLRGGAQVDQHPMHALSTALPALACPWRDSEQDERKQEKLRAVQALPY